MILVTETRAIKLAEELKNLNARVNAIRRNPDLRPNCGDGSGVLVPDICPELATLEAQLATMRAAVGQFRLVKPTELTDVVRIGNVITIEVDGVPKKGIPDEVVTLLVGGYGDDDPKAKPLPIATNMSPLVMPFYGRRVGHEGTVDRNGCLRKAYLAKIGLPAVPLALVSAA